VQPNAPAKDLLWLPAPFAQSSTIAARRPTSRRWARRGRAPRGVSAPVLRTL